MVEQVAEQDKETKIRKLTEFREQLETELESAEQFKRDYPDREDVNALVELTRAIEEEARAVADLVEIGEDCPEDWSDLEEARTSLTRTLARIQYHNWIALGPSGSKRINQLFFYQKSQPESKKTATLLQELKAVARRMLTEKLNRELRAKLERFLNLLEKEPGKGFFRKFSEQVSALEESMDISFFDGSVDGTDKCAICDGELAPGTDRCSSCGAPVLSVEQAKAVDRQEEAGRSQLLDSLNHSWKLFQHDEINQENFLRILKQLSQRISAAIEFLESPTAALLDFSTRLELFTQLQDRRTMQNHWPSLVASGRALVAERLDKLERDER